MTSPIEVDVSEPQVIQRLLDQAYEIQVVNNNAQGWADYKYKGVLCYCHGSDIYNCERKTWNDLISGIEPIEEQLRRQMDLHPQVHHRLYVEGVVEPAAGGVLVYSKASGRNLFTSSLRGNRQNSYSSIMAWLRQVGKTWEVVYTPTMEATAIAVGIHYKGDQVDESAHGTFRRMFKQVNYTRNPQAEIIMGASGKVAIGQVKAEALAEHFGTAWRAFKASPEEWMKVYGIGRELATKYLRNIGRGDV